MMKDPRDRSPSEKSRVQRLEWNPDPYLPPPTGFIQEKPPLRRLQRASPPELLPGRVSNAYRPGTSIEREEYNRRVYDNLSRSPPFEQSLKWSHIDEEIPYRKRPLSGEVVVEGRDKFMRPQYRDSYEDEPHDLKRFGSSGNRDFRFGVEKHMQNADRSEYVDSYDDDDDIPNMKNFHAPGPSNARYTQEKHYRDSKYFNGSGPMNSRYGQEEDLEGTDRSLLLPPQVVGPPLKARRSGGTFPMFASGDRDIRLGEEEEIRVNNNLRFDDKIPSRAFYEKENDSLLFSGGVYNPKPVSSHLKDFESLPPGVSKEKFHVSSEDSRYSFGVDKRQGKYSRLGGQDGINEFPQSDLARDHVLYPDDLTFNNHESKSARLEHWEYTHHEHGRIEEGKEGYRPEIYRHDQVNGGGSYTSRDSLRPRVLASDVDKVQYIVSPRENFRESNPRGHHPIQGEPFPNYRDIKSNMLSADRDGEVFRSGSNNFGMKPSGDSVRTQLKGDYGFGKEAGPLPPKERLKRLQMSEFDTKMSRHSLSPQRRSKADQLSTYEPTERMLKRRYPIDDKDRSIPVSDRIYSRQAQELSSRENTWTNKNQGELFSSKRSRSQLQFQNTGKPCEGRTANQISPPGNWNSSHDVPEHLQTREIDYYAAGDGNLNTKERLRSCSSNYNSYPMDRREDFYISDRTWKRNLDNKHNVLLADDDGIPLDDMEYPGKPDLPEDSGEFRQLLQNLFLQFSKRLNENPSTQRRYREQGNSGSLLCIVCGRLSKEFLDTRRLLTHTFMCRHVGKRAHHLALNKAICVLMGWKSVIGLNGACVYETLPETEALTLKEDLILWPPLVIIHNSSVLNDNSDGQHVITIERMEDILRGLGFSGGKLMVRYGSPMNQSILVVKFLPTFTGLQEAEKLHNYFKENKRDRGEFQRLKFDNRILASEEAGKIPENKAENFLYGYMGIAEDLDKLDFGMRKKSDVKSKKDIQAIADAPLKTESEIKDNLSDQPLATE